MREIGGGSGNISALFVASRRITEERGGASVTLVAFDF